VEGYESRREHDSFMSILWWWLREAKEMSKSQEVERGQ
jgi:hypothetical protein